jgi:hypothetical protein
MFKIRTGSIDSSNFNHLVAKVEESNGKLNDIKFDNLNGVSSVATYIGQDVYSWINLSTGCSKKIELTKGFKIHVIPQLEKHAEKAVLEWSNQPPETKTALK